MLAEHRLLPRLADGNRLDFITNLNPSEDRRLLDHHQATAIDASPRC